MNLNENLKVLRKQKGYSQEQLASKLNVSRQAVSKWESGSYPELESLIALSEIFECSVDELLKTDLSNYNQANKQQYENHYNLIAKAYTFAIVVILLGISMYLVIESYFPENTKYAFISQIILLFFILAGVICFVYFGIKNNHFEQNELELTDFYSKDEREKFNQKYALSIATGVGIIILGLVFQVLIEQLYNESLANSLFMLMVTLAVGDFVYFGILKGKYDKVDTKTVIVEKSDQKVGLYCGIIMLIATIIYLLWSFMLDGWKISWIIFPIAGLVCGIVWIIIDIKKEELNN